MLASLKAVFGLLLPIVDGSGLSPVPPCCLDGGRHNTKGEFGSGKPQCRALPLSTHRLCPTRCEECGKCNDGSVWSGKKEVPVLTVTYLLTYRWFREALLVQHK